MKLEQLDEAARLSKQLGVLQDRHDAIAGFSGWQVTVNNVWDEGLEEAIQPAAKQYYLDRIEAKKQELRALGIEVE
jgi:hypothetical protein